VRRVLDERGEFTLVGLLVAMTLSLVVLGATLDIFASSEKINRDTQRRTDALDRARVGVDRLARQLRNMASPTPDQPQSIDRATAKDVVFQTVDPIGPNAGTNTANVKRVRYCLDAEGRLWAQNQRWIGAAPGAPNDGGTGATAGTCPSAAWNDQTVLADDVTNYLAGHSRPVFTFNPTAPLTAITWVHVDLWLDLDTSRKPAETVLSSGVFLRNQNRAPSASFTATPSAQGIVLNGSDSVDPEGEPLTYCWYDKALPNVANPPAPCDPGPLLGTGVTITDQVPSGTQRTIYLVVKDPALLTARTPDTCVKNLQGSVWC
jgi:hypothetical protein